MRKTIEKALTQFSQLYELNKDDDEFMQAFKELRELHWAVLLDAREFHKKELKRLGYAVDSAWQTLDVDIAFENSDHEMPDDITHEEKLEILELVLSSDRIMQEINEGLVLVVDQYMEYRK